MHHVFLWLGGSEKIIQWCNQLTNCSILWNFQYWLMCLWHALLTEREINKITFSTVCAVHGLLLTECLSIELVSIFFSSSLWRLCLFQLLLGNSFSNFCACSLFKQIHWSNYVIKVSFSLKACLQTAVTCGNTSFPKKLQSKVSKHEVWCKIIDAFISQEYRDITCRKLWILVEVSSR